MHDADDWSVLACAMMPGCPVWTQDADIFWHRRGHVDPRPGGVVFGGVIRLRYLAGTLRAD
ncbi:PIN domain-containing protein [Polaromonas hydrogenivorans]